MLFLLLSTNKLLLQENREDYPIFSFYKFRFKSVLLSLFIIVLLMFIYSLIFLLKTKIGFRYLNKEAIFIEKWNNEQRITKIFHICV